VFGATWGVGEVAKPNLKLVEMTIGVCAVQCGSYDRLCKIDDGWEGIGRANPVRRASGVDVIKPRMGHRAAYSARRRSFRFSIHLDRSSRPAAAAAV
jgi:hypothetical protein